MKPVFDENGLAVEAGDIRCFYYDAETREYTGWSDEFINIGVSMPGNSTDIDPGDEISGKTAVFTGSGWMWMENLRGETIYSTDDGSAAIVDYIGPVHAGFTTSSPATPFDIWDGEKWVTDATAAHAADVAGAEQMKKSLLTEAESTISDWKAELALGIISDEDKASLIKWLAYIKNLKAVDSSSAPDINWPVPPEV